MYLSKLQNLFFGDNLTSITNTGSNLIVNGSFNASLTGWTATNFVFDAGTAKYERSGGCYGGLITQDIVLTANKKYKVSYKYKATSAFDILISAADNASPTNIIYPETTTHAITNGLWQLMEFYIISPVDITVTLSLEAISTGGETPDACGATGTEESGFWLDDVTMFLTKRINRNCEDCDVVVMDSNKNIEFQVKVDTSESTNLITNNLFETNPFDLISQDEVLGSGTPGFSFVIDTIPTAGEEFILYYCGKVIRIKRRTTGAGGYSYTVSGIYYEVQVKEPGGGDVDDWNEKLILFFNEVLDPICDTTSIYSYDVTREFLIFGNPDPVYISNPYGIMTDIFNVTPTDIVASNFVYDEDNDQMCYRRFNNDDHFYQFSPVNLVSGQEYRFEINYNSLYDDFTVILQIDDGTNVYYEAFTITSTSSGTASVTFTALLTASTTLTLILREPCDIDILLETPCHDSGFCFSIVELIAYSTSEFFTSIRYLDCQGVSHDLEYSTQTHGDNILVQLPILSGIVKIIVTDIEGNEFESVGINLIDFNTIQDCVRNQYLKLNWFDDCTLDNVDYANLPFMNEVYLYGSIKEINNIQKERTVYYGSQGSVEPVFSHRLLGQTISIANYSNNLHRSIMYIFDHKFIYVNDERIKIDGGKYEILKLRDGNSSGEIECIIDGSELINSGCCC